jgi:hypothetical protein
VRACPGTLGRRCGGPLGALLALAVVGAAQATPASAQFSDPCGVPCAGVLGATAFTAATGVLVGYGRLTGGVSTISEGLTVWGVSLAAFVGTGIALSGHGERQERAVYSAGIGSLAGSLLWLGIESTLDESDGARKVAAALMGAAAGALVGGVYGALSHEAGSTDSPVSLLSVRVPF